MYLPGSIAACVDWSSPVLWCLIAVGTNPYPGTPSQRQSLWYVSVILKRYRADRTARAIDFPIAGAAVLSIHEIYLYAYLMVPSVSFFFTIHKSVGKILPDSPFRGKFRFFLLRTQFKVAQPRCYPCTWIAFYLFTFFRSTREGVCVCTPPLSRLLCKLFKAVVFFLIFVLGDPLTVAKVQRPPSMDRHPECLCVCACCGSPNRCAESDYDQIFAGFSFTRPALNVNHF